MLYIDEDEDAAFAMPCMESYESVCASLSEFSDRTALLVGAEKDKPKTRIQRGLAGLGLIPREGYLGEKALARRVPVVNKNATYEEKKLVFFNSIAELGLALYLKKRCSSVPDFVDDAAENAKNAATSAFPTSGLNIYAGVANVLKSAEVTKNPRGALARLDAPLRHTLFGVQQKKYVSTPTGSVPAPAKPIIAKQMTTIDTLKELNQPTQTTKDAKTNKIVVVATAPTFFSASTMSVLWGLFEFYKLDSTTDLAQRDVYFLLKIGLLMLSGFIAEAFREVELSVWNRAELIEEAEASAIPSPPTSLPVQSLPVPVARPAALVQSPQQAAAVVVPTSAPPRISTTTATAQQQRGSTQAGVYSPIPIPSSAVGGGGGGRGGGAGGGRLLPGQLPPPLQLPSGVGEPGEPGVAYMGTPNPQYSREPLPYKGGAARPGAGASAGEGEYGQLQLRQGVAAAIPNDIQSKFGRFLSSTENT
jgi:hypothetical protein